MKKKSGKVEIKRDVPRGVVIILLIAIILISAINTFAILNFINEAKTNTVATTAVGSQQGGIVTLTLIEPPEEAEGGENE